MKSSWTILWLLRQGRCSNSLCYLEKWFKSRSWTVFWLLLKGSVCNVLCNRTKRMVFSQVLYLFSELNFQEPQVFMDLRLSLIWKLVHLRLSCFVDKKNKICLLCKLFGLLSRGFWITSFGAFKSSSYNSVKWSVRFAEGLWLGEIITLGWTILFFIELCWISEFPQNYLETLIKARTLFIMYVVCA